MVEPDTADPNHRPLAENLERLERARLPDGRALSVIELPMPEPVTSDGVRLPASYANFYVGNAVVLLPVFGGARDHLAIDVLASCFPGRRVVPIDSREVVFGLGAWHCLSQQVPAF
jgi:agmatine deiminase